MSSIALTATEKSWMEKNMASPEEKQAYEEYVNYVKEPINEEWEPLVNYSPEDKEYYKLLDLIEMSEDMNAFEDSNNCHQLLSRSNLGGTSSKKLLSGYYVTAFRNYRTS